MPAKDITGIKFGRLLAVNCVGVSTSRNKIWEFLCDCGNTVSSTVNAVSSGNTKSCGCLKIETTSQIRTTHGLTKKKDTKKAYEAWIDIKRKCYDPNSTEFCRYGAKGRYLQDSWLEDPVGFVNYVLSLPNFELSKSIDRVDNTKSYVHGNLRWATPKMQARNKGKSLRNTSGVEGVMIRIVDGSTFTTAFWRDLVTTKSKSKNFSVKKHGLLPAFSLAVNFRRNKIKELNAQGAGYSETHGL